jgi:hypothetical protein
MRVRLPDHPIDRSDGVRVACVGRQGLFVDSRLEIGFAARAIVGRDGVRRIVSFREACVTPSRPPW